MNVDSIMNRGTQNVSADSLTSKYSPKNSADC